MELLIRNNAVKEIAVVIFMLVFSVGFVFVSFSAGEKVYTSTPILISIPIVIIIALWFITKTIKNGTFVLLLTSDGVSIELHNSVSHLIKWEQIESIKSSVGIVQRDYTPCKKTFGSEQNSYNNLYIFFQDNSQKFYKSPMRNGAIYEKIRTDKKLIIANLSQESSKILNKIQLFRDSVTK